MGINAEREITSHGLAINCNTEMKWFGNIVPCGIADKGTFFIFFNLQICVGQIFEKIDKV